MTEIKQTITNEVTKVTIKRTAVNKKATKTSAPKKPRRERRSNLVTQ